MQGKGSAVKERAPSTRRPRRTPKERPRPQQTAPLEPAEDPIKGTAVKERAPSQRRRSGKAAPPPAPERARQQQTAPLEPAEDPIKGTAVKERAPSQRRPVKGGKNARA